MVPYLRSQKKEKLVHLLPREFPFLGPYGVSGRVAGLDSWSEEPPDFFILFLKRGSGCANDECLLFRVFGVMYLIEPLVLGAQKRLRIFCCTPASVG